MLRVIKKLKENPRFQSNQLFWAHMLIRLNIKKITRPI